MLQKIKALYIYPIKSIGGVEIFHAKTLSRGLELDRQWMLVDEQGNFMTQREIPQMANIRCRMQGEGFEFHSELTGDSIFISNYQENLAPKTVKVWEKSISTQSMDPCFDIWCNAGGSRHPPKR